MITTQNFVVCICVQRGVPGIQSFAETKEGKNKSLLMHETEENYVYSKMNTQKSEEFKKSSIKSKIGLFISTNIVNSLRSLIMQKYGKYERGLLSHEVELALRHWIGLHTNAQISKGTLSQPINDPLSPKVQLVFSEVKTYLLRYYDELKRINIVHLEEAIANVRGSDPRTIKKWIKTFHKLKLIRPVDGAVWEILE